jgi:hypothetical protein
LTAFWLLLAMVAVILLVRRAKPAPASKGHQLRAPTAAGLPPIEEFDLRVQPLVVGLAPVDVPSSADAGVSYVVDPEAQSCSCQDWQRRSDRPKDHLGRYCKHLMHVLREGGAFDHESAWVQEIAALDFGGPTKAWRIALTSAPAVLVTSASGREWVNVLARTTKKGERINQASGPIRSYGWNVEADRWSYGEGPAGARELTPVMRAIL